MQRVVTVSLFYAIMLATSLGFSVSAGAGTPKLIVVISYDQLRGDRLEFFKEDLGTKGFARVRKEGVVFDTCLYKHAVNLTAPGHSVLMTGADPYRSGIVGNEWFDRKKGRMVYATEDTSEVLSPRHLLVPTLGDLLQKHSAQSKVIGLSIKDRPAILMTGQHPTAALWLDGDSRGLGSSAHYKTPSWVAEFNAQHDLSRLGMQVWNASQAAPVLPSPVEIERYIKSHPGTDPGAILPKLSPSKRISLMDSVAWEGNFPGGGKNFPHIIPPFGDKNFWEAFICTPYSIDWIMEAAKTCIEKERLGKDEHTDILCVGVSTTDEVGHLFGPNSREMKEIIISADKYLGEFIDYLDREVGRDSYELVISGDHGVAEVPESPLMPGDHERGRVQKKALNEALQTPYQALMPVATAETSETQLDKSVFIKQFSPPFVFLDSSIMNRIAPRFDVACDTVCAMLKRVRGIGIAVPTSKVLADQRPADIDAETWGLIRHSVYAPRSGEVVVYPSEGWLFGSKTTTHGTPYRYDRWVPLMFLGNGLDPKVLSEIVHPEDLAPTLAEQLKLKFEHSDGKALELK